ncbi:SDR family NAD(P)-dependent oxidoreductase [Catenulispora sp. NF23]|nr:type I polyketide synthase [Catenulispora pinistramenti]MBS2532153.1 SDR family NAD(P)-dependent oxidoreductase [Catenulispora pinistramenti]
MTNQGWAEPVAIVGMGCRYPGGIGSPEDLWRVLSQERDVISDFPADRGWQLAAGQTVVTRGGFLAEAAGFDPAFFGISPREALAMDPQQRQLLEVAWETLERAGLDPAALRGSATGVFVGAEPRDYGPRLHQAPEGMAGHLLTGTATSVASGRIAYALGLAGPTLTVDTSASSSLVAVHLAAQSLMNDECALALAGGACVLAGPGNFVAFSGMRGLAPDGRCKPFADAADGTVWSEGVGLVVLERLSDARRNGHRILAVLRGTAINNDGAGDALSGPVGLTVPNPRAQQAVIQAALAAAGLSAADIDAVEAHGTGTRLGDLAEASALLAGYGRDRPEDRPLWLGSVKSNLGHTLAAAGVAGLIKTVLALGNGVLPRTLNVDAPSSRVDWDAGNIKLLTQARPWPSGPRVRRAGVSSFGISGTNVHAIVEEAPAASQASDADAGHGTAPAVIADRSVVPWLVSARSASALRGQAERLREFVQARPELDPTDVARSLATSRSAFEHRAVVTGGGTALAAVATGSASAAAVAGVVPGSAAGQTVFVFPGQGSQWAGMGRELAAASPVFAERLAQCGRALAPFVDWSLDEVLADPAALETDDVVQPALWAVMVSLAAVWQAAGIVPDAVVGHSQGEIAAATVAGALTLDDAARVVALRSRALRSLRGGGGGMVSVAEPADAVRARIAGFGDRLNIAVVNGPSAAAVSGELDALAELVAACEAEGVRTRRIPIDYASHSSQVEQLRDQLDEVLAPAVPAELTVPMVSTVSGQWLQGADLHAGYWYDNLRQAVQFDRAVRILADCGHRVFLEMSPHPVLTAAAAETLADHGTPAAVVSGSLRRDDGGPTRLLHSFAEAWVRGVPVDWPTVIGAGRRVDLPTYAFQHERYWLAPAAGVYETSWQDEYEYEDDDQDELAPDAAAPTDAAAGPDPLELVRSHAAVVLGHPTPDAVVPDRTFKELGFDSVTGVELRDRLAAATGVDLPLTLIFDEPTPAQAARFLGAGLARDGQGGRSADGSRTVSRAGVRKRRTPRPVLDEPIAIVAMSCRYPGDVTTPEELWDLLARGGDAVGAFPADRGWDLPDTPHAQAGGFVRDVADFDPGFFGISPREALAMDPQQRLLLETSWEAFERVGLDHAALRGSATGVFVGAAVSGYGAGSAPAEDGHLMTGTAASVMSGRVAYTFGLEGPAVTVDTACSSSLVALHLACQSLRSGECDLALAGGISIMTTTEWFGWFSRQHGLASDGRSKAFSAAADGMGMAEGAGMIVVERLSDARRNGHQVLAVVRGSAVNQDGASNGLTAPNGPSQQRVIRAALDGARLVPSDVDVVEAHGTGTPLGDPIEAQAILATYGRNRPEDRPLWLGSVKSNLGHTQWAAGAAGIMKMVLALGHGELPRTLHADEPTPHVDWSSGAVRLLTDTVSWPSGPRPRRVGVSSFGISGTNAHVILEGAEGVTGPAPIPEPAPAPDRPVADPGSPDRAALPVLPWLVSARTAEGLPAQARRLHAYLTGHGDLDAADIAWSLADTRSAWEHRAVLLGADRRELLTALSALADDQDSDAPTGVSGTAGRLAFVFTGQGAQRHGMGRELAAAFPVFAAAFDQACAELDRHLGGSVAAAIDGGPVHDTMWTQAGLFALEVALYRLLESWGVRPDLLAGHSIGEIAAAHVAGVWSLPDACALVAARGRLMQALPAGGAMIAVAAAEQRVREVLSRHPGAEIAAVNGPQASVISGLEGSVAAADAELAADGTRTRRLQVSHAFHSASMEPMLAEFATAIGGLDFRRPELSLVSALTGAEVTDEVTDPAYWVRHVRETVRFGAAVDALRAAGARTFVEIGPDAALTAMGAQSQPADGSEAWLAGLRRDRDEVRTLLTAVASAQVRGVAVDWSGFFADRGVRHVELPTYAFQRGRYWLAAAPGSADAAGLGQAAAGHPLLGAAVHLPADGGLVLTGRLAPRTHPWLADHVVAGSPIVPGTAFVDLALHAGAEAGAADLEELVIDTPLRLPERGGVQIRVTVAEPDPDGRRGLAVYSRSEDAGERGAWIRHAAGTVASDEGRSAASVASVAPLPSWPSEGALPADAVDPADLYAELADIGLPYGPAFRGLRAVWRRGAERFAEIELPAGLTTAGYGVHPALLDAALHAIGLDGALSGADGGPRIPFAWTGVRLFATEANAARVRIAPAGAGDAVSVTLTDPTGAPIIVVDSLVLREAPTAEPRSEALHRLEWVPAPEAAADQAVGSLSMAVLGSAPADALAGVERYADLSDLVAAGAAGTLPSIVFAYCDTDSDTDNDTNRTADSDAATAAHRSAGAALDLIQRWLAEDVPDACRLVLVTTGAVDTGDSAPVRPAAAPIWGLVRTAQTEHPGRFILADVDETAYGPERLAAGLALDEPQFAIRADRLVIPRLTRSEAGLRVPDRRSGWHLAFTEPGSWDNLRLVADGDMAEPGDAAEPDLAPGEVRVGLRACGVNFRDVLNTLGMYPGEAGPLGLEGAGVVLAVGSGVTSVAVGDRVMGLFRGAFTPVARTDARLLTAVPDGWTFAEAAAAPVVFLTAYHALVELAALRAGESVLIHAAAGGVGLAAVQLARHLGADVYGTASTGKWPALRALGLAEDRLASSRTLEFEAAFRAVTDGRGVDVVLDSLAGEFVDASLRLTAPGGRFVEMGKADIRDAARVAADHGLEYQAFDLLELDPERISGMLAELSGLFADRALSPLPVTCWDVRHAPEAFRQLSQARLVGKVVLTVPDRSPALGSGSGSASDDTVLITGATGGLGALVARRLAAEGRTRHLLLASRRGPAAPGAAALAADVAAHGADVSLRACDVASRPALAGLLAAVPADRPLSAVVHAAGVLDDGTVAALTGERLAAVLRPKVDAAWHLHELTADRDVRAFVLFSSVAGIWGNPGQSAYAAANTFLDAVAAHRRRLGLPGTALAWGPWEQEAGMAGRLAGADRRRMARDGFRPIGDAEGLELLAAALDAPDALLVPAPLDPAALAAREDLPPFLSGLVRRPRPGARSAGGSVTGGSGRGAGDLATRLAALAPAERFIAVRQIVLAQTAVVLGMTNLASSAAGRSFRELGLDSLTSVELRNRLFTATGLRLAATVVFDHPTPTALTEHLLAALVPTSSPAVGDPAAGGPVPASGSGSDLDTDPLVIVGIGCRFPGGVQGPQDLWDLVLRGDDALSDFPTDRGWDVEELYDPDPTAVGKTYAREGGFLHDAAEFDAAFFGINPREALAMDPQQRLLLETSWAALEDAGIDPATLRGTPTGVFTGLIYHDYGQGTAGLQEAEGYLATGGSGGVASGRLSYILGLEGPAVTIDTACSSSLVALHLAVQALRAGECSLALAGGVTVMSTPGTFIDFSRQRGLSPDGRCKAYAEAADGTGWGEGVGVLVLERLSDARRRGHRVWAVVAGSAINQDGASNGLTAPNGPSQQRVIRAALAASGLTPADVDVVEGHGTGTTLGDPIEANALLATYGQDRAEDRPLWLGSVKSNIGHTQAAAGVAGIIKMVTAMAHGVVPPTLHVDAPSSHVDWATGQIQLPTEAMPWPQSGRPRRAGVSAFGFSGTNAHVILEEPPIAEAAQTAGADPAGSAGLDGGAGSALVGVVPWIVSGGSDAALRDQAARLRESTVARSELDERDVAWSLAATRSVFEHRAVVIGSARQELAAGLAAVATGQATGSAVTGSASATGRSVFVFPGQGAQWAGMGSELAAASPVFAERLAECGRALAPFVDWSLTDVLNDPAALEAVDVVQPALWAVMVSLAAVWQAAGITPDAVIGHSQGEIAAATVAGALSLEDGARVVALRSRALRVLAGAGGMVSVAEPVDAVRTRIAEFGDRLSIAVVNGPSATVVSGEPDALSELLAACEADEVRARRIPVDYASHSAQVEQLRAEISEVLAPLVPGELTIPMVSAVSGEWLQGPELDADYWFDSLRSTVEFHQAVRVLAGTDHGIFLEMSPHPVLTAPVSETLEHAGASDALVSGSLRRDDGGPDRLLASFAEAWVGGVDIDWPAVIGTAKRVDLPTYAFQRQHFWPKPAPSSAISGTLGHPFLATSVELASGDGVVLTGSVSLRTHPWLADHAVAGTVLLPGTAFVEMAVRAGDAVGYGRLDDLVLEAPLTLSADAAVHVQVVVGPDTDGRRPIEIHSRPSTQSTDIPWIRHAGGAVTSEVATAAVDELTVWPPRDADPLPVQDLYGRLTAQGYGYGPAFQGVRAAWRRGDTVFAEVALPDDAAGAADGFGLHPALLDAALHISGSVLPPPAPGQVRLPFGWTGVSLHASGATVLRVRLTPTGPDAIAVTAADGTGSPVVSVDALALRPIAADQLHASATSGHDDLFAVGWTPVAAGESAGRIATLGADVPGLSVDAVFADVAALVEAVRAGEPVPDLVLVAAGADVDAATATTAATPASAAASPGAGSSVSGPAPLGAAAAARGAVSDALAVVQRWLAADELAAARLVVVTRGAVATAAGESVADLSGAAVWGLIRSAQSENPDRFILLDIPSQGSDLLPSALASGEPELAIRSDAVLARRLTRPSAALSLPADGTPWRLEVARPGTLDGLSAAEFPPAVAALEPGQVRVAVRAAGVNFRDVVLTLGLVPADRDPDAGIVGSEVAGVVAEVGSGVTGLVPGDRVMGIVTSGFAPLVVADARTLTQVPAGWSYAEAAAVPVAFSTAWYGLVDLAQAARGHRILIHAATGGAGSAAVQVAKHLGLEVFATASPGKWDALRAMGLDDDHIASSRDAGFERKFAAVTANQGMDIVLNALAGELTDASLRLLPRGGAFIEMGKTDPRDPDQIATDHPGVRYRAFSTQDAGPDRLAEILTVINTLINDGVITRMPVRCWDVRRIGEAFRFMSQAKHIGKVVLTVPRTPRAAGTVLVSGGTGMIGGRVARHLAASGRAGELLLTGRSGPIAGGVPSLAAGLAGSGAGVSVVSCDAADREALAGLLASVPVSSVFHSVGILDDGVLTSMTPERVDAVMRPKADGAWNLHNLTADRDLDAFVLFSSAAATFGSSGQGNYAAANAFLDGLAAHRQSSGLPATALAWGLWSEASAMTGHLAADQKSRLGRDGINALTAADGLALLDTALSRDEAMLVPALLDVPGVRARAARGESVPAIWRGLAGTASRPKAAAVATLDAAGLPDWLAGVAEADRDRVLLDLVRTHVAAVLGHDSPDAAAPDRAFKELGFDSLTAVELRNRLGTVTGLRLPSTLVFDHPTPVALARFLRTALLGDSAGSGDPAGRNASPRPQPGALSAEPIAIVAMSCRFPGGVDSPEDLWELMAQGRDAVAGFPADRGWNIEELYHPDPDHSGTSYVREGGFVDGAGDFDPAFFGISPREALAMDPQQRLLLETSWEAFERAGIDPAALRGSDTGVFVGAATSGYGSGGVEEAAAEGYLMTGTAASVISGRVAYTFGLEGPAVTVETACSSSLVAMHLAGQALRAGECDLALAGGVTVVAVPGAVIEFSRQRGLAPDGRSKAFSDAADGMGIAEGVGMVVLERLSDARRNGHQVLAVVRGSAINQDGASNGLTAPNGPSQQRVIRAALAASGLKPSEVDAVEAHGTGTELGDPIEAGALMAVYGQDRPEDQPLWLGSVKSNIGHTQWAAGAAGVIKMVLALRHAELPRTLHVAEPSSHIDWDAGNIRLLSESVSWPVSGRPRRAGVSSFGISGTNAHVILEEPPVAEAAETVGADPTVEADSATGADPVVGGVVPWIVSGRSDAALCSQAERLRASTEARPDLDVRDVAWSLASTRAVFEHRAVVIGSAGQELGAGLAAAATNQAAGSVVTGSASATGRSVFVFPGQGAQWAGMGRDLAASSPVFAERLAECGRALAPFVDWSLTDVLSDPAALEAVDVVQPALWAVMVSLAAVWQAAGVTPDAVIGHSQGEIAAATVAGALSLEDGARVVALRSRALRVLAGAGGMVSVAEPVDAVRARIAGFGDRLSIAVVNGPSATVVSGEPDALSELLAACEADEVRARRIPVDYASHSAQVEQLRAEITEVLAPVTPTELTIPMVSAVSGEWLQGPELAASYWFDSLRATVEFDRAVRALADSGHGVFLEMSPHPVLTAAVTETLEDQGVAAPVVSGSLRRDNGSPDRLLASFAEVWVRGVDVDWPAVIGASRQIDLPTYAFQHQHFWPKPVAASATSGTLGHPFLATSVELVSGEGVVLTGSVSLRTHPWLADHAVGGTVLLPGTAFVEMAVRAGDAVGYGRLDDLVLEAPLTLSADAAVQVQVMVGPDTDGNRPIEIHARPEDSDVPWTRHAAGVLALASSAPDMSEFLEWPPRDAEPVAVDDLYDRLASDGYGYGPAFQGLRAGWRRGDEFFAEVVLPTEPNAAGFGLHPALLDAALHISGSVLPEAGPGQVRLPFAWTGVSLYASGATVLRVRLTATGNDGIALVAADSAGMPVVSVESLVLRPAALDQLGAGAVVRDGLFAVGWTSVPAGESAGRIAALGAGVPGASADAVFADVAALVDAVRAGEPVPDLVLVAAGANADADADASTATMAATPASAVTAPGAGASARGAVSDVLAVVQQWLAADELVAARLVVVTRGAVATAAGESVADLSGAAVWGLIRSAQSENPDRFVLLDLPSQGSDLLPSALASGEPELAIRGDAILARRLTRPADGLSIPTDGTPWRVEVARPGTLDGLAVAAFPSTALEPGQVRIAVRAAGVNFRDVLITLGMYPGEALLGSEVAGVVAEVGPGVQHLSPGDRVMAMAAGGFGPFVVVDARTAVLLPSRWSFAEAAAVPIAFSTAWYGLVDLAQAARGQRILIHAATGGVGSAAVQIAKHLGLEVFATASPGKWDALRAMGLDDDHIASSRDAGFERKFAAVTANQGMDIVLNALAGELTDASLRLLSRGGAFIEMGKTDPRDPDQIATDHPGVRYRMFETGEAGPGRLHEILTRISALIEDGVFTGMPVRCWDIRRIGDALRFMSQAKHVGKIVLTVPRTPSRSGTVLITGGTGMIGGRVARHLAASGRAGELLLTGRSGPAATGVPALAAALAESGAGVSVVSCDAADRAALAELLAAVPVTGVYHSTGVLDDGVVAALTPERVDTVMRPKADGAWNLHDLTADRDLDAFVLFSSAAASFGGAGQANYAAANAFLDGLAAHRQSAGLPATALAWGLWADASAMTGHLAAGDTSRINRGGIAAMTADEGLALMDAALTRDEPLLLPALLDVQGVRARAGRGEEVPVLWRGLVGGAARRTAATATGGPAAGSGGVSMEQRLAALAPAEQDRFLLDLVQAHVAAVLGYASADAVRPDQTFREIGFDSLTAVDLRNRINAAAGTRLPSTLVFDYPTPTALAGYLRSKLVKQEPGDAPVLRELDGLEAALAVMAGAEPDGEGRTRVLTRLEAILQGLRAAGTEAAAGVEEIGDATDDDLFDLIDNELGLGGAGGEALN